MDNLSDATVIALVVLAGVFILMFTAILKEGIEAGIKLWGTMGALTGVAFGSIITYYFADKNNQTELALLNETHYTEVSQLVAGYESKLNQTTEQYAALRQADNAAAASSGQDRTPEYTYSMACMTCHSTGVAGAPILTDTENWSLRLNGGIESIYTNTIRGYNSHPPKGLCSSCSDDEIKEVADYMLKEAGVKN